MGKVNVHEIWSFADKINKETGAIEEYGLFPILGIEGTARELKKRCEAEVQYAGAPLAGCSFYALLILHWVSMCILGEDASDPRARTLTEKHMLAAGEKEIVDLIEEVWGQYKDYDELPADIQYNTRDDAMAILEARYGEIAHLPDHLTPEEVEKSKVIALSLGTRERRRKPAAPVPEEPPEESEPEPEPAPPEPEETAVPDIRAEIDAKIKRAG